MNHDDDDDDVDDVGLVGWFIGPASSINAPIGALTDETDVMSEIIGQV